MKFEHLVQINDPTLPHVAFLSREQVWLGLVARAWKPTQFILGLEDAQVTEKKRQGNTTILHRTLNYGPFQIQDTVELSDETRSETKIQANIYCGPSSMSITIEEPEKDLLWLRFKYHIQDLETDAASDASQSQIDEARRQAYHAADIDTVKLIRELALMWPTQTSSERQ